MLDTARPRDATSARGRMTMFGMTGTDALRTVSGEVYLAFFHHNGMLANRAPSYRLTDLENEVLAVGGIILNGDRNTRGVFTAGGLESNFLAIHAIREWAWKTLRVMGQHLEPPMTGALDELGMPTDTLDVALLLWNMIYDPREILDLRRTLRWTRTRVERTLWDMFLGALRACAGSPPQRAGKASHAMPGTGERTL